MQKGSCILCFAVHIFFDIDSTIFSARFELTSEREHIITDGWLYKRVKTLDFFLFFFDFCALFQLLVCKHSGHVSFNFLFCFFLFPSCLFGFVLFCCVSPPIVSRLVYTGLLTMRFLLLSFKSFGPFESNNKCLTRYFGVQSSAVYYFLYTAHTHTHKHKMAV